MPIYIEEKRPRPEPKPESIHLFELSGKDIDFRIESDTSYISVYSEPEYSDWICYMFGGSYYVYTPVKGEEPNAFWRFMQYICFGNKWVKKENK